MKYLTPANAQRIADRIMEIVPYNINIMDSNGVIIASGAKNRIGTLHQGALKAIALQKIYQVDHDTSTERKGINLPIQYGGKILGVIGISGDPEQVMQLGMLVVTTAQLMIENDANNEKIAAEETRLNNFFFEWTHRSAKEYSQEFVTQADYYHINLKKPRVAALFTLDQAEYNPTYSIRAQLGPEDYLVSQAMNSATVLFEDNGTCERKTQKIMALSAHFRNAYVGDSAATALEAIQSAHRLAAVAQRLQVPWPIVYYRQLLLESKFSSLPPDAVTRTVTEQLRRCESGDNLRLTILNYVEHSDDLKRVCGKLFIHRNTLNYRIEKIREATGLNLKNGKEMMMLYISALQLSLDAQQKK